MDDYLSKPIQQAELTRVLAWAAEAQTDVSATMTPVREELPPYDRAAAVEQLGGDEGIFAEIASLFLEDAPRLLAQLRTAVADGDAAEVHRTAHGLKGATGYVGGVPAAAAAQRLEAIGAVGDLTGAPAALLALEAEIGRLAAALATPVFQPCCSAS
jgi:HPt (histidine-containing phosphotransfer) domain-containing protein